MSGTAALRARRRWAVPGRGLTAGGTPVALASTQRLPTNLAVDATNIYWTVDNGTDLSNWIMKMPLSGGTPVPLAKGAAPGTTIALDATRAYYLRFEGGATMSVLIAGGEPEVLSPYGGVPIVLGATDLFFPAVDTNGKLTSVVGNHMLVSLPKLGGQPAVLTSSSVAQVGLVNALAVGSANLYWSDYIRSTIETVPSAGGTRHTLAS
jgi:hypothetical protein